MKPKVAYLVGMNDMIEKVKIAESQIKCLEETLDELKKTTLTIDWKEE